MSFPPKGIRDTILHEIATVIAGPEAGHGPKWKAVCRRVGARSTVRIVLSAMRAIRRASPLRPAERRAAGVPHGRCAGPVTEENAMYDLPKEPSKLRQRIRRYERAFEKEFAQYGMIGDGAGKRYLLAPLYLIMGDLDGAVKSFAWYAEQFPDDSPDPGHYLCWALALHRVGDEDAASQKLGQAMLANLHLLPRLFGENTERLDIWYGSNIAWPDYVDDLPPEFFDIWTSAEREWARQLYTSEHFTKVRTQYIDIESQLRDEPRGPRRSQLVDEAADLSRFDRHRSP